MSKNHNDIQVILTNTGKYRLYEYKKEQELEDMVIEHSSEIFGKNSHFFKKRKITTKAGKGTITDGFVIDFTKRKLYVIEVELIKHDLYGHILPQISTFSMALENEASINNLVKIFMDELPEKRKMTEGELKKIVKNWGIIIIIDEIGDPNVSSPNKRTNQLMEVVNQLSKTAEVKAIPFQTFTKNTHLSEDHIHSFRTFSKDELEKEAKKWTFKWETVSVEKHLEKASDDLKHVFHTLSKMICCISPDIKEVHRKKWTTYQLSALKNFCTVKVLTDTLEISLKMDETIFSDKKGITRDIQRTPAWTFDKVLNIGSREEIEDAIVMVKQAHESLSKTKPQKETASKKRG